MKVLHVTIELGVGPDDDGAFDVATAETIHWALCRAFPLCRMSAIVVHEIGLAERAPTYKRGREGRMTAAEEAYLNDNDDDGGRE